MTTLQDPLAGLSAYVRSVEAGSFSAAARALGTTPSAVSKAVAKLEARLGARLLQRGTRALRPTAEGHALYERGLRIVAELDAAQAAVREARGPRGPLRVTAPVDLGRHWLAPRLPAFLARYPQVTCELSLTDRFVDLVEERFDAGLRMGEVADARLVRRRLGPTSALVCAAPRYLRKHGTPRRPEDLAAHDCLAYTRAGRREPWRVGAHEIETRGSFGSDNNDALLAAAVAGVGVVRLPRFVAAPEVARGRLRVLLPRVPSPGSAAYAVYPAQRHLSPRVRAFVDFLVDEFAKTPELL